MGALYMVTIEQNAELSNYKQKFKKKQRKLFLRRLFSNKLMVTGGLTIIFLMLVATLGPMLVSFDPYETVASDRLQKLNSKHLLGTDEFGRDLLARIVYGAQTTMGVGFTVTVISSIVGKIGRASSRESA